MIACEITQQMEVVGDPRTEWVVLQQEGHVAEREQGYDDPSGIARDRGVKEIVRMHECIAFMTRCEITPAVAQVIEVPIPSGVGGTQLGELCVETILHGEHVRPKVVRKKREPVLVRHHGRHDRWVFVVEWFHVNSSRLSQAELPEWRVSSTPKAQPSGPWDTRLRARGAAASAGLDVETGVLASRDTGTHAPSPPVCQRSFFPTDASDETELRRRLRTVHLRGADGRCQSTTGAARRVRGAVHRSV